MSAHTTSTRTLVIALLANLGIAISKFVAFVLRHHPAEEAARMAALRAERYGADFTRELAEIEDGTHPVQQLRC